MKRKNPFIDGRQRHLINSPSDYGSYSSKSNNFTPEFVDHLLRAGRIEPNFEKKNAFRTINRILPEFRQSLLTAMGIPQVRWRYLSVEQQKSIMREWNKLYKEYFPSNSRQPAIINNPIKDDGTEKEEKMKRIFFFIDGRQRHLINSPSDYGSYSSKSNDFGPEFVKHLLEIGRIKPNFEKKNAFCTINRISSECRQPLLTAMGIPRARWRYLTVKQQKKIMSNWNKLHEEYSLSNLRQPTITGNAIEDAGAEKGQEQEEDLDEHPPSGTIYTYLDNGDGGDEDSNNSTSNLLNKEEKNDNDDNPSEARTSWGQSPRDVGFAHTSDGRKATTSWRQSRHDLLNNEPDHFLNDEENLLITVDFGKSKKEKYIKKSPTPPASPDISLLD
jgi:hypothetical protein